MAQITYTADDGSTVQFVDPAGVAGQVAAAIAALPTPTPVEGEVVADIEVVNTDGTQEEFTPEPIVPAEGTTPETEIPATA